MKKGSYSGTNVARNISLSGGGLCEFGIVVSSTGGYGGVTCIDAGSWAYG